MAGWPSDAPRRALPAPRFELEQSWTGEEQGRGAVRRQGRGRHWAPAVGIGRVIALELAGHGADVAFNYLKNHRAARETQSEIEALGVRCLRVRSHLADPDAIASLFARIADEFGKIDILVNNAASGVMRPATELDVRHWDWTLDINARAPWVVRSRGGQADAPRRSNRQHIEPRRDKSPDELFRRGCLQGGVGSPDALPGNRNSHRAASGVNAVSAGYVMTDAIDAFPRRTGRA